MMTIRCEVINQEMIEIARMIANWQKETVTIITPTETMEVHHEEVSEGKAQEDKETQEVQQKN